VRQDGAILRRAESTGGIQPLSTGETPDEVALKVSSDSVGIENRDLRGVAGITSFLGGRQCILLPLGRGRFFFLLFYFGGLPAFNLGLGVASLHQAPTAPHRLLRIPSPASPGSSQSIDDGD